MNYFERKEELKRRAVEHNKLTDKPDEFRNSVVNTEIYWTEGAVNWLTMKSVKDYIPSGMGVSSIGIYVCKLVDEYKSTEVPTTFPDNCYLNNCTTMFDVEFYAMRAKEAISQKIAILNFASYKNPGGMFMEGSSAQEESICHETNLYHILSDPLIMEAYYKENRKSLNRALYTSKALYTPDVTLYLNSTNLQGFKIDVITCAAPNFKAFSKYRKPKEFEIAQNQMEVKKRIQMVIKIAELHHVDILVLGAFGCGVFGQDPVMVAREFMYALNKVNPFKCVHFAIPGNDNNYDQFAKLFKKSKNGVVQ